MFYCLNLSVVFKSTFLFNEAKAFVSNRLKWHLKLQHLFLCRHLLSMKMQKCVVPLGCAIFVA